MFYIIKDGMCIPSEYADMKQDSISVGYLSLEDIIEDYEKYGIDKNVIDECSLDKTHFRTTLDVYDQYSFGIINIINLQEINHNRDRIGFVIKKDQFILIKIKDDDDSTMTSFENAVDRFAHSATLEKVIYGILEKLLSNGNEVLEKIESNIMEMEKGIINGKYDRSLEHRIYAIRKTLTITKNYYEQLVDIGEELQNNENNLFDGDLRYFKLFTDKSNRLSSNTQILIESLVHLRETLDATVSYSQNNIMKLFTVVTSVFMPLTLIVGWYGMNFKYMPELQWKYSYAILVGICLILVAIIIYIFKKKKFL